MSHFFFVFRLVYLLPSFSMGFHIFFIDALFFCHDTAAAADALILRYDAAMILRRPRVCCYDVIRRCCLMIRQDAFSCLLCHY